MCPVDDHPIHPMTVLAGNAPWGCHSINGHQQKRTVRVKDGYRYDMLSDSMKLISRLIADPMSKECQYCISPDGMTDSRCDGCTKRRTA